MSGRTKSILKGIAISISGLLVLVYLTGCTLLYLKQEHILFHPDKLEPGYTYHFSEPCTEVPVMTKTGEKLSAVLFRHDSSKGVIFYLHGNAGCISSWGEIDSVYKKLGYDLFILDYPGYGKSQGQITSQQELFDDIQTAYDTVKQRYPENKIVVLGYSIGTGPAAMIAANNHPARLILQAPYYSMKDMMRHTYPIVPTALLKYPLPTNEFLSRTKCPVVIFHGDVDDVIYYGSSVKLKAFFKPGDTLVTLKGQNHNAITYNTNYQAAFSTLIR